MNYLNSKERISLSFYVQQKAKKPKMMIKRYLITIYLLGLVALSHTQVDLFKDNALDSAFLHSLLEKRVVVIGERHNMNENIEFQTQTIKFLNDHGYRVLLECNFPEALMYDQYVEEPTLSLLSLPKFEYRFVYVRDLLNKLRNQNFKGNIEHFDIKFSRSLAEWGWYVLHYKEDFKEILTANQLDSIRSYFYEDNKVNKHEYITILINAYSNSKNSRDTTGVFFDFITTFDEAVELNSKFRIILGKRYFAYRELKIIELLEKKYFQQDDTSKYVIVTGRSHAWLKGFELIKSTFSEYLANKLGRENVSIIISTYPRREYLSNKIKKHLGVNNDDWYNFKQLKKNLYIVNPNPNVDYLLILNE